MVFIEVFTCGHLPMTVQVGENMIKTIQFFSSQPRWIGEMAAERQQEVRRDLQCTDAHACTHERIKLLSSKQESKHFLFSTSSLLPFLILHALPVP